MIYSKFAALEAVNLAVLWAVALIRIPIAIRSSPSFLWWLAIVVEALSMTISHPSVGLAVNRFSGIANIESLLKHLLFVAFEALIFLAMSIILGKDTKRRRLILGIYTGFTVTVMTVGFSIENETANTYLLPERPGISLLFLYSLVYVLYAGGVSITAFVLFVRFGNRAESKVLRVSLGFLALSFAAGVSYATLRASLLFAFLSPPLIEALLLVMYLGLLLFSTGSLLSAVPEYSKLVWTYRSHRKLYPLWKDLTGAMPEIALIKPGGVFRELSPGGLDLRFQRRVVEIRDGLSALRRHIPVDLPPRALQFAERKNVPPEAVDVIADACVLEVARRAKVHGRAAQSLIATNPYRLKATGATLFEEAQPLCELANFHRGPNVNEFAEALELEESSKFTTSG